jgi:putative DNA methylase
MSNAASPLLIPKIPWSSLDRRVGRELINRERYAPTVSLYRWWARRPHAVIGAILDQALEAVGSDLRVADPFSGGGTVAVEARRRGLPIYAQDLHPWPVLGLSIALDGCPPEKLEAASKELLKRLAPLRTELYVRPCPVHGDQSEIVHLFWVKDVCCPSCSCNVSLFPYSLVTKASRNTAERHGYFGCSGCGGVTKRLLETASGFHRCGSCEKWLPPAEDAMLPDRVATCRHCDHRFSIFDPRVVAGKWRLVLVQRLCRVNDSELLHFDTPGASDHWDGRPAVSTALSGEIPPGVETSVLRSMGFATWADLYPDRQLRVLVATSEAVRSMKVSAPIRRRLLLAVCGAAEMAGHLSRWDRYYPKAFEAIANHRFAVVGFSCETNLLGPRGRGTLPRRLRSSVEAAKWMSAMGSSGVSPERLKTAAKRQLLTHRPRIAYGSSERLGLKDASVDLVLTDPPYFDDVQYGELGHLFFAWAKSTGLLGTRHTPPLDREAVPNSSRGNGTSTYEEVLSRVFKETNRVLKTSGRLLLTFHNTDLRAWAILSRALAKAGFKIVAMTVVAAENQHDHGKRGHRGFTKDLVLECRVEETENDGLVIVGDHQDSESAELIAAGKALHATGDRSDQDFARSFQALVGQLNERRIVDGFSIAAK